jgi:hypothetical protein
MNAINVEISTQPVISGTVGTGRVAAAPLTIARRGTLTASALTLGRQLPKIAIALLTPAALVALAMGLWRVAADLEWASVFPISAGLFAHWQVWIALSIALKMLSTFLLAWDSRTRNISEEN